MAKPAPTPRPTVQRPAVPQAPKPAARPPSKDRDLVQRLIRHLKKA